MRPRDIITAILFTVLLVWIFLLITENKVESDLKQSEIDHLKKTNEAQRDSLEKRLELTREMLIIQIDSIRLYKLESESARKKSQKEITTLKNILFVKHDNDSLRIIALKKLYTSWR